jgi:hypothetical protein
MRQDKTGAAGPETGGGGLVLQLGAEINAQVGRVAAMLERQAQRQLDLQQAIQHIDQIPVPQITSTNGSADYPELLGPRTGFAWDVRRLTVATFTAGSVNVYVDGQDDTDLRLVFPQAGTYTLNGSIILEANHRLIFAASAITGNASISIAVDQIALAWLPAYLL